MIVFFRLLISIHTSLAFFASLGLCCPLFAQTGRPVVKGRVYDAITGLPLSGVTIRKRDPGRFAMTNVNGAYNYTLERGEHSLFYFLDEYQRKMIRKIRLRTGQTVVVDVFLSPGFVKNSMDSVWVTDTLSVVNIADTATKSSFQSMPLLMSDSKSNGMRFDNVDAGLYRDLHHVATAQSSLNLTASLRPFFGTAGLLISGMGDRYNQFYINGSPQLANSLWSRSFALSSIPVEMIEELSVSTRTDGSMSSDFSGGNLEIRLKDAPDRKFGYVQIGMTIPGEGSGETFFNEKRSFSETMSFPGFTGQLPDGFPTSKSKLRLGQMTDAQQIDALKTLRVSVAPQNLGNISPGSRFVIGWGNSWQKKNKKFGLSFFLTNENNEQITEVEVQSRPDVRSNPYPFKTDSRLVNSYSTDKVFTASSFLTAYLGSSIAWNKNRISVAMIYGGQNINSHTQSEQIFKPDEDSLADKAVKFATEQRRTLNFLFKGDHAFGAKGRFRLDWRLNYTNYNQNNPQERTFLLREDPARPFYFEIAQQQTRPLDDRNVSPPLLNRNLEAIFNNTGIKWSKSNESFLTAAVNLSVPFTISKQPQVLKGGIFLQSQYRLTDSDLFLFEGSGFKPLGELLSSSGYDQGTLDAEEYYNKLIGNSGFFNLNNVNGDNLGAYFGSLNTGAAFVRQEGRLMKNFSYLAGVRAESASQLISLLEYNYFPGFDKPDKVALNANTRVTTFNLLPVAGLTARLWPSLQMSANYFRTLNRPLMEELSDFRMYDAGGNMVINGNRLLAGTTIDNYRVDMEWRTWKRAFVRFSGYYRSINSPIEYLTIPYSFSKGIMQVLPYNMPEASVRGLELAFNIPLSSSTVSALSRFRFFASGNINSSKVNAGPLKSTIQPFVREHNLAGTPDYAVNAGISMAIPKLPYISFVYARTGDYLRFVGSGPTTSLLGGVEIPYYPDYRVKGRSQIDVQVSHSIFHQKLQLIAGVSNISEEGHIVYQDLNGNGKFDDVVRISKDSGTRGFFVSGSDTTPFNAAGQRAFYFRMAYKFQ